MRKPNLHQREQDIFDELGLELKRLVKEKKDDWVAIDQTEGLKDLTKQNLSKDVKPLDTKD